jgi:hypothetical protein
MSNRAKGNDASRDSRDTDTREATTRKSTWKPPSVLPDPTPEPGYHYRWVRARTMGESDNRNVSSRFREGYVPVKAEDHKDLQLMSDRGSEFADNVEVGGLVLCKTSLENKEAREEYYSNKAATQMESVDNNFMREQDPRMPLLRPERSTRVTGSFKK